MYTLERKVRVNSENELHRGSQDQGFFIPPMVGTDDIPLMWFIHLLSLGGTLNFPHFLPYLVHPELLWCQMHDGSPSNHMQMTL